MSKHEQISLFSFDAEPVIVKQPEVTIDTKVIQTAEKTAPIIDIEFEQWNSPVEIKKSNRGRKKINDNSDVAFDVNVPADEELFKKQYYSIGKVAKMFNVNISLIRFWEKEFDILKPKLNGKGDRHFRPEDVKNLQHIHHLLRVKKYTISGANEFIKKNNNAENIFHVIETLQKTKLFLNDLKMSL